MPAGENIRVRRNCGGFGVLAALVCALIAMTVVPAVASAVPTTFTVDTTGDAPKTAAGAVCETETGECTLRAAIEAANTTSLFDEILFDPAVFDGTAPASTITLASPLPPIIHAVEIDAGHCPTSYGVEGPCAEVVGLPASSTAPSVFTVSGQDVTIGDLAIEGGLNGILDTEHGVDFTAVGDWFGIELNRGLSGGSFKSGVVVEENNAIIGGETRGDYEEDRNVFGLSQIGVDVQGSSHTSVQGNYIGVDPTGSGPASLGVGVRIVDAEGSSSKAADDEVGGILTAGQAASLECDGPCNVIATEGGTDIDLTGEAAEPASGPTAIRGNYLGLVADGLSSVGENSSGVVADPGQFPCGGGPGDVTVGGAAPTESNYIDAGSFGIFAEGAENFRALGNSIGFLADGSPGESPIAFGIEVCAEGVTEPAQISSNDLLLGPGSFAGIVSEWGRAEISGNTIRGGQIGVLTGADSEGHGDLIKGNIVTVPELDGIQIQSQSNTVIGNTISGAGQAGIDLEEADFNRVGGDLAGEENGIEGSGVGAILVSGSEATRDEIRGNSGSGNAGSFIQLLEGEPGERPNAAVEPPIFATALQSSATGMAKPDSTVRIFSKASAEAGELASLLAVAKADSSGNWTAAYATVPVGTLVAATETSAEGATSEVSTPSAATADPVKPIEPEEHAAGGGGGGGSGGSSSSSGSSPTNPPISPKPPKAKINKHPAKSSKSTTAKFTFKATPAAGAKFQCKLDAGRWASCKSPKTYKHLKPRKHTFQVRATAGGLTGPAAKFKFTVKR